MHIHIFTHKNFYNGSNTTNRSRPAKIRIHHLLSAWPTESRTGTCRIAKNHECGSCITSYTINCSNYYIISSLSKGFATVFSRAAMERTSGFAPAMPVHCVFRT